MKTDSIAPLISARRIQRRVIELATRLDKDYGGAPLTVLGILNGSFMFLSDLVRRMKTHCVVDFVATSSYRNDVKPGRLRLLKRPDVPLEGKRVLLVDDILDTGRTLHLVRRLVLSENPLDLRICVMLAKQRPRKVNIKADYVAFDVPDRFVVGYGLGYGLDDAGDHRQLPYIGILRRSAP